MSSHRHTHRGTRWPDGPWTMTGWLETLFPFLSNSRSENKQKMTACLYLHFWCVVHPEVSPWDFKRYALIFTFITEPCKFWTWVKCLPAIPAFQFCFSFPFHHFDLGEPRRLGSKGRGGSTRWRRFSLQTVLAEGERQWEAKIKMSSQTTFPFNVLVTGSYTPASKQTHTNVW